MYPGYPDFQHIVVFDGQRFVAAWQQDNVYYLYPSGVAILAAHPLAFSLDIIRSNSEKIIYGRLDFTTELQFANTQQLISFKQAYTDKTIRLLPISPGQLSFSGPLDHQETLSKRRYDAVWHSAKDCQFIIFLDEDNCKLLKHTLTNHIITFSARLDGYIKGIAPRLPYQLEFNPAALINELAAKVDGTQRLADDKVLFHSDSLFNYFANHLTQLPMTVAPEFKPVDITQIHLFSQTIIDHLNALFGASYNSPASNNILWTCLQIPPPGREMIDLSKPTLVTRPLCFTLDPFAAARQIAREAPETIIHELTAPPLPVGMTDISLSAALPPGLPNDVIVDIQISVPPGQLYPARQTQTQPLNAGGVPLTFRFYSHTLSTEPVYQYQIRITCRTPQGTQTQKGAIKDFTTKILMLDNTALPCQFLTLNVDLSLTHSSRIIGTLFTGSSFLKRFVLTQHSPELSYPLSNDDVHINITAEALNGTGSVVLPTPVTQTTTLGIWSFPQFGHQQALITVYLPPELPAAEFIFQQQNESRCTSFFFTQQANVFEYRWNVTSLYAPGFRYRTPDGEWSEYVTGNQTIDLRDL